jgi:hypothetical protein
MPQAVSWLARNFAMCLFDLAAPIGSVSLGCVVERPDLRFSNRTVIAQPDPSRRVHAPSQSSTHSVA